MPNFNSTRNQYTTILVRRVLLITAAWGASLTVSLTAQAADGSPDYLILATSKTSTMEKEINAAAAGGYRFSKAMGGKSANGGQEVIVAMAKDPAPGQGVRKYILLATTKTSTMEKEMQQAADEGYAYLDQTVFKSAFGGDEVAVIMEFDPSKKVLGSSYRLLATTKTSTMQNELREAAADGYILVGLTVGKTAIGGDEIVTILRKD